jgi:hypothetical protein
MPLPSPFSVTTAVTAIRGRSDRLSISFVHQTSGSQVLYLLCDRTGGSRTVSSTVNDFGIGYGGAVNATVSQHGDLAFLPWQLIASTGTITVSVGEGFMQGAQNV